MPTYRGISKAEIVSSIAEAQNLLLAHSTGPALEDHLGMVSDYALDSIAEAASEDVLARAIENSHVQANFTWINALLVHHALANTDGKGEEVYNNLQKWGALNGVRSMLLSPVDVEIQKYIGCDMPRNDLVPPGANDAPAAAPVSKRTFVAPPRR